MPNKKTNIIKFPTAPTKLERQVEAILFAASEPLDIETIEKRVQTNTNMFSHEMGTSLFCPYTFNTYN